MTDDSEMTGLAVVCHGDPLRARGQQAYQEAKSGTKQKKIAASCTVRRVVKVLAPQQVCNQSNERRQYLCLEGDVAAPAGSGDVCAALMATAGGRDLACSSLAGLSLLPLSFADFSRRFARRCCALPSSAFHSMVSCDVDRLKAAAELAPYASVAGVRVTALSEGWIFEAVMLSGACSKAAVALSAGDGGCACCADTCCADTASFPFLRGVRGLLAAGPVAASVDKGALSQVCSRAERAD
jgi:hypothetical protein